MVVDPRRPVLTTAEPSLATGWRRSRGDGGTFRSIGGIGNPPADRLGAPGGGGGRPGGGGAPGFGPRGGGGPGGRLDRGQAGVPLGHPSGDPERGQHDDRDRHADVERDLTGGE